jgi:hypothetical protein
VLFADIDHAQPPAGCVMPAIVAAVVLLAGAVIGTLLWHWLVGLVLGVAAVVLVNAALLMRRKQRLAAAGGAEGLALQRVDAFSEQHPDWHLRAYRTPAGLRVLAMRHVPTRTNSCRRSSRHWAPTPCTRACAGAALLPCPTDTKAVARRPEVTASGRRWLRGQPSRPTTRTAWPGLPIREEECRLRRLRLPAQLR